MIEPGSGGQINLIANRNTFILHLIYFTFAFTSVYIVSNKNLHNNTTSTLLLIGNTSFQFSFKNVLSLSAEAATGGVLYEKVFPEIRKIHRKTPVPESLF